VISTLLSQDHLITAGISAATLYATYRMSLMLMNQMKNQTSSQSSTTTRRRLLSRQTIDQDEDDKTDESTSSSDKDPHRIEINQSEQPRDLVSLLLQRYGHIPELSTYEKTLLANVIMPHMVSASFDGQFKKITKLISFSLLPFMSQVCS
jgi:hypothetical protein